MQQLTDGQAIALEAVNRYSPFGGLGQVPDGASQATIDGLLEDGLILRYGQGWIISNKGKDVLASQ